MYTHSYAFVEDSDSIIAIILKHSYKFNNYRQITVDIELVVVWAFSRRELTGPPTRVQLDP